MKSNTPDTTSDDLFRSRLDQIINMRHELVLLSDRIDWTSLDNQMEPLFSHTGRPAIPSRMMIGLHLLKQLYSLSDEEVCSRWVNDPYF